MGSWIERFKESLKSNLNDEKCIEIIGDVKVVSKDSPVKKSRSIKNIIDSLDKCTDENKRKNIMQCCGRKCISKTTIKKAKKIMKDSKDIDSFLSRLNEIGLGGGKLQREDEKIYAYYDKCYCGWVKATKEKFSSTYCNCSIGWFKELFESVLEKEIEIELEHSIIQGGDNCKFIIYIGCE